LSSSLGRYRSTRKYARLSSESLIGHLRTAFFRSKSDQHHHMVNAASTGPFRNGCGYRTAKFAQSNNGSRKSAQRPLTTSLRAHGRIVMSIASMGDYVMNRSTARSSTRCGRLKSSSKAGAGITTRSARMPLSDTNHQHRRCSYQRSPRGRLRLINRLRRPRWQNRHR
jgi:hypothetical protein